MSSPTSKYDIEKIRQKMAQKISGRRMDPFEFRPQKAGAGEVLKYRFYVLPDLSKGDKVQGGVASRDMELFVLKHGQHWINNQPHACPRLYNDEECDLCQVGFDALNEIHKSETEKRAAVRKQWLSSSVFAANIYFPPVDPNPKELHGKVMWYNAPKQVFDIWHAALGRDSIGDQHDPEAFGVIYNPYNAFLFQLVATPFGNYNEYKSSKFIAAAGAHPIAMLKDRKPDEAAIQAILDCRHDLYTKVEVPSPDKIHRLCQQMLHGADSNGGEITPTTPDDDGHQAVAESHEGKSAGKLPGLPNDDEPQAPKKPAETQVRKQSEQTQVAKRPAPVDDLADEAPPVKAPPVKAPPIKAPPAKQEKKPVVVDEPSDDQFIGGDDSDDIASILSSLKKGEDD